MRAWVGFSKRGNKTANVGVPPANKYDGPDKLATNGRRGGSEATRIQIKNVDNRILHHYIAKQ